MRKVYIDLTRKQWNQINKITDTMGAYALLAQPVKRLDTMVVLVLDRAEHGHLAPALKIIQKFKTDKD
jgi:hypothetical protein